MQIQILRRDHTQTKKSTQNPCEKNTPTSPIKKHARRTYIILTTIALLTISAVTVSCKYGVGEAFYRPNNVNERSKELTSLTLPETVTGSDVYQEKKYNFLIISDMHYGADYNVPERKIFNWLDSFDATAAQQQKKPLFCLILGDIVDNGNREDYAAFNTFQSKLERKGIPVYCIVGNHDLLNSGWNNWKYTCNPGTSFYKFQTNGISWYFTDTGSGTMGSEQLNALESAFSEDENRKLVFSHYPLYGGGIAMFAVGNEKERARLINLYAKNNVKYVFEGHWHIGGSWDFGKFKEHVSQTLKSGKIYLVSMDETTTGDTNPVEKIEEIDLNSL